MPEWPPSRYTVLRVFAEGHRAELLGEDDDDLSAGEEEAWREHWRFALAFAHAYAEETDDGDSLVIAFVPWESSGSR